MAEFHVDFRPGGPDGNGAGTPKDLDDEDPFEFVACRFVSPPGHDTDLEMARTFVEEFALMGYSRRKVRGLFETEFFGGTHDLLTRRGPEFVEAVLDEVFGHEVSAGAASVVEGN
ncbi:MAG: hypothetical protein U0U69_14310 [Acidimicrobiia bacterium]